MQSIASEAAFMPLFQSSRLIFRRLQCSSVQVVPKRTPKPGPLALPLLLPMQVSLLVVRLDPFTLGTFFTVYVPLYSTMFLDVPDTVLFRFWVVVPLVVMF
ncbi:hypothetical protein LZ683_13450 [Comamonas testosteroni]|uniref:hypothetical protein n=1 Tax=Comamonas testosteroni TaxID=285 RepID=UPI0023AAF25C|nr:hypothetical protein [Comamonas testosteroni]WEE80275.1 hypothetical protein LZ683_13450 [Comamonas testosteroni]